MADTDPCAALLDISGKNESLNRSSDPIPDPLVTIEEPEFDPRLCRPFRTCRSIQLFHPLRISRWWTFICKLRAQ
jgi:hypothetical protein